MTEDGKDAVEGRELSAEVHTKSENGKRAEGNSSGRRISNAFKGTEKALVSAAKVCVLVSDSAGPSVDRCSYTIMFMYVYIFSAP